MFLFNTSSIIKTIREALNSKNKMEDCNASFKDNVRGTFWYKHLGGKGHTQQSNQLQYKLLVYKTFPRLLWSHNNQLINFIRWSPPLNPWFNRKEWFFWWAVIEHLYDVTITDKNEQVITMWVFSVWFIFMAVIWGWPHNKAGMACSVGITVFFMLGCIYHCNAV